MNSYSEHVIPSLLRLDSRGDLFHSVQQLGIFYFDPLPIDMLLEANRPEKLEYFSKKQKHASRSDSSEAQVLFREGSRSVELSSSSSARDQKHENNQRKGKASERKWVSSTVAMNHASTRSELSGIQQT